MIDVSTKIYNASVYMLNGNLQLGLGNPQRLALLQRSGSLLLHTFQQLVARGDVVNQTDDLARGPDLENMSAYRSHTETHIDLHRAEGRPSRRPPCRACR